MPDISMCRNETCDKKMSCYRYRAIPNPYRQSYAAFGIDGEECSYYINFRELHEELKQERIDEALYRDIRE